MLNVQLLDDKIEQSGFKVGHLVDTLGLSRQGFDKKRKGKTPFRKSEIDVLSDLLGLTESEKSQIFFT